MQPPSGAPPTGEPTPPPQPPSAPSTPPQRHGRGRRPQRSGSPIVLVLVLILGAMAGGTCATCVALKSDDGEKVMFGSGGERVGVVEVLGPIAEAKDTAEDLRRFAARDDLRAIVVRIDSPGGAVAPSQEIFHAMQAAAKKKPVVASMGSVAASGGFWISLGAEWVFASPGTITGSIGVIMQTPDLTGVADALRFRMRTYKSGPLKDAGNPFREMKEADEALFDRLIDDIYTQFVEVTAQRRGLPVETVKRYADGRIMTGRAAEEADLVDELGGLYEAAKKAVLLARAREAEEAGETVDTSSAAYGGVDLPTLVYPKPDRPSFVDLLRMEVAKGISEGVSDAVDRALVREPAPVELR